MYGVVLASHDSDEDGTAHKHKGKVGDAGGKGLLVARERWDVHHCGYNEDIGNHDKQHDDQHKESGQEELHTPNVVGV
jgi:hypothetical protein